MSLKKTCRCGNIIDAKEKMCKECEDKHRNTLKRRYSRYNATREDKQDIAFYNTNVWKRVSNKVRGKFFNCCALCLCNSQKIFKDLEEVSNLNYFIEDGRRKNLIHHIIEFKEDTSKATNESNLICVCEKHHRMIHNVYENGNKERLQRELGILVERWMEKFL